MSLPVPQPGAEKRSWWGLIIPVGLLVLVVLLIEVFGVIPD